MLREIVGTDRSAQQMVAAWRVDLQSTGWAVIRPPGLLDMPAPCQATVVTALAATAFELIRVFENQPLWRHLDVDLGRPPNRSRGRGHNSLHMDFVNAAAPPEFVLLYCVQSDPLGGGASLLASTVGMRAALSASAVTALTQPRFVDGTVDRLLNIGCDTNPFPVLSTDGPFPVRYTAKLLDEPPDSEAASALAELQDLLDARTIRIRLEAGDLLAIDQRKTVHGRDALGEPQEGLAPIRRRVLKHGFGRERTDV